MPGLIILTLISIIILAIINGDLIIGLLYGVIVFLFLVIFCLAFETEDIKKEDIYIYALKDNSTTTGSFFLGSGTVEEEQRYFYIIETSRGKKVESVKSEKAYIKEGDYDNPYIEIFDQRFTNGFARWMYGETSGDFIYVFHVPENSVTNTFNIDLDY